MGWVRFLCAAAALPAIIAGLWLVIAWQNQADVAADIPILISQPAEPCEAFQALAVSATLSAERLLEEAPARAYAAAADAFIASELAAAVCDPMDWADPKLRTRPPELQNAAYNLLSDGAISGFEAACEAMSESVLVEPLFHDFLIETGQADYAQSLKESAAAYVCVDHSRRHVEPQSGMRLDPALRSNLIMASGD